MKLTDHFSLAEMISSETASRLDIDNTPSHEVAQELTRLCQLVLEPLRNGSGKVVVVTSGYRCPLLNKVIRGSRLSDHMFGRAADIKIPGMTPLNVCKLVVLLNLPVKQVIHEGSWCHVSIHPRGVETPRREQLTAHFTRTGVTYTPGLTET